VLAVYLLLPLVIASALAIAMALKGAADEAGRLGDELRGLGELRPALVEVRTEAERTRDALRQLHLR
jgi:hypothetical protein